MIKWYDSKYPRFFFFALVFCIAPGAWADEARMAVVEALNNESAASPKRWEIAVSQGGKKVVQVMESVLPDRFHLRLDSEAGSQEAYVIGDSVFLKEKTSWRMIPHAPVWNREIVLNQAKGIASSAIQRAVLIGEEPLGGKTMHHYEFHLFPHLAEHLFRGTNIAGDIWIDSLTKLPAKLTFRITKADKDIKVTQSFDYDSSIKVEPPSIP